MRLDVYITQNGMVKSRTRAAQLIENGAVLLDGKQVKKPGVTLDETVAHKIELVDDMPYVGRGGYKLAAALDSFGIDVRGAWTLDIGASTGGFTDCLLQRGAVRAFCVDAGSNQLDLKLQNDPRVTSFEHCNARYLTPDLLGADFVAHGGADCLVMDVSFISATCILPVFGALMRPNGCAVVLIKPQFEVGKEHLGKGGIVKSEEARREAVARVLACAALCGLRSVGVIPSPIEGGDGNREYLCCLRIEKAENLL